MINQELFKEFATIVRALEVPGIWLTSLASSDVIGTTDGHHLFTRKHGDRGWSPVTNMESDSALLSHTLRRLLVKSGWTWDMTPTEFHATFEGSGLYWANPFNNSESSELERVVATVIRITHSRCGRV